MAYIFRLYRAKTDSAGVRHMPSRNISAALLTSVTPHTIPAIRALHSFPASALAAAFLLPPLTTLPVTLLARTRPQVHTSEATERAASGGAVSSATFLLRASTGRQP